MEDCLLGVKMKLNIIYDSRRTEKYEPLMNELKVQVITDYELWPCMILPEVVESINASHKMIVQWAKDTGLKEICIAEDDLIFTASGAWNFFIANKPDKYDLYLSSTYGDRLLRQTIGFHLYCVQEHFYDQFLGVRDNQHIDTEMWGTKTQDYHFCYPYPALQRPGFSANNKCHQDYNSILKPEDIYQG